MSRGVAEFAELGREFSASSAALRDTFLNNSAPKKSWYRSKIESYFPATRKAYSTPLLVELQKPLGSLRLTSMQFV